MFLVSLELGGRLRLPALPHMRVGWKLPVMVILAIMFVMPHDPSTRMQPSTVGSHGYTMAPRPTWTRPLHLHSPPPTDRPIPMRVVLRSAKSALRKASSSLTPLSDTRAQLPKAVSNYSFTTVEELRDYYGPRQNWWGDFDARQTRELYHSLLPRQLLEEDALDLPVEDRARQAVAARRAARLYARERGLLPVTLACQLLDGIRVFAAKGSWQPDGLSEDDIFAKYVEQHGATADTVNEEVYYTILRKSCSSNSYVDAMVGLAEHTQAAATHSLGL